jgi:multidrug efflux pump subunit AcrA (membrane-fusion protein)
MNPMSAQSHLPVRLCVAAVLTTALLTGCGREAAPRGPSQRNTEAVPVTVAPVLVAPVQRTVGVVGTLYGDEETTVSAKVAGRITAIYKDVGDRAAAGEPLAQIERTDYELLVRQRELAIQETLARLGLSEPPADDFDPQQVPTVARALLQAHNAEARFTRGQQLHEQNLLADQDFADLRTAAAVATANYQVELLSARAMLAEVRSRQAELALASQRLADTEVRVPHAARPPRTFGAAPFIEGGEDRTYAVTARMASVGEYVREGTPLFRLVDDDPVKLRCPVPERHVAQVRVGQRVALRVDAWPEEFSGRIERINPQVDVASRTFQVEVVVPNADRRLKPGSFAKGVIYTVLEEGAIFVPQAAHFSFAGVHKVFVVRDGKAQEILIEIDKTPHEHEGYVRVIRGLQGDERVITSGLNRIATGVNVLVASAAAP